jgi:hypothetical protein
LKLGLGTVQKKKTEHELDSILIMYFFDVNRETIQLLLNRSVYHQNIKY